MGSDVERARITRARLTRYALLCGMLAMALGVSWHLSTGGLSAFDAVVLPAVAVVLVASFGLLHVRPRFERHVGLGIFATVACSLLGKLIALLWSGTGGPAALLELMDVLYWFPICYPLAFLFVEGRSAVIISAVFAGATIVVCGAAVGLGVSDLPSLLFLRFALANVSYVIVTYAAMGFRDATVRNKSLARLAENDVLTGVLNRRGVERAIAEAWMPPGAVVTGVMVDIDEFKRVNDELGHPAGDEVLRKVAEKLGAGLRSGDRVGRWGGEEFLLVLPGTQCEAARVVAERLRASLAAEVRAGGRPVTGSFGVAERAAGSSAASWVADLDRALYLAKAEGRNRVVALDSRVTEPVARPRDTAPAG